MYTVGSLDENLHDLCRKRRLFGSKDEVIKNSDGIFCRVIQANCIGGMLLQLTADKLEDENLRLEWFRGTKVICCRAIEALEVPLGYVQILHSNKPNTEKGVVYTEYKNPGPVLYNCVDSCKMWLIEKNPGDSEIGHKAILEVGEQKDKVGLIATNSYIQRVIYNGKSIKADGVGVILFKGNEVCWLRTREGEVWNLNSLQDRYTRISMNGFYWPGKTKQLTRLLGEPSRGRKEEMNYWHLHVNESWRVTANGEEV